MGKLIELERPSRVGSNEDQVEADLSALVEEASLGSERMARLIRTHCGPVIKQYYEQLEALPRGCEVDVPEQCSEEAAKEVARQVWAATGAVVYRDVLPRLFNEVLNAKLELCREKLYKGKSS